MGKFIAGLKLGSRIVFRTFKPRRKRKYEKIANHIKSDRYRVRKSTIRKNPGLWL